MHSHSIHLLALMAIVAVICMWPPPIEAIRHSLQTERQSRRGGAFLLRTALLLRLLDRRYCPGHPACTMTVAPMECWCSANAGCMCGRTNDPHESNMDLDFTFIMVYRNLKYFTLLLSTKVCSIVRLKSTHWMRMHIIIHNALMCSVL